MCSTHEAHLNVEILAGLPISAPYLYLGYFHFSWFETTFDFKGSLTT
jgi:hypothetical protein